MSNEIKKALGLGEVIKFEDGTQLPCVPASLADLEDALAHWNTWANQAGSIHGAYMPGNTEAKEAFEELLYIACGRKIEKEDLRKKIRMHDGGKEVVVFIDRFLGFKPREAAAETEQE